MFYEFNQNNSYGYFDTDDKLCHVLIIEADTFQEAISKAEELGCYWDGVSKGIDCPCCGDRWSKYRDEPIDIERYRVEGYKTWRNQTFYFNNIEEYAQYMANDFGWTTPAIRIFYKNGTVKEFFNERVR